ncbi:hypothetical protein BC938DRAFT_482887 [Jimgerdemannia flammicorona]|uniref:UspA domain-containing protein n=1 Tax=Jimgerdemannia flammicorona TaxID=994334 RepID=A0A433QD01_9FUNG|nr:hypothetical protein BC938DRAFT_482887 [Jimgerdemannia flammicorona]
MEMQQQIEQKVNEALKQFVELFKSHGIPAESHTLKSRTDSRNVIVDYTNSAKADLLILGSRDLTGWKRVFLGSFSDYVQAHVHCPVLIVREIRVSSPTPTSTHRWPLVCEDYQSHTLNP